MKWHDGNENLHTCTRKQINKQTNKTHTRTQTSSEPNKNVERNKWRYSKIVWWCSLKKKAYAQCTTFSKRNEPLYCRRCECRMPICTWQEITFFLLNFKMTKKKGKQNGKIGPYFLFISHTCTLASSKWDDNFIWCRAGTHLCRDMNSTPSNDFSNNLLIR